MTTASGPYVDPLGRNIPSGTIFDPTPLHRPSTAHLVRNPFPSNKIPVTRFDPVAAKILALVPQPLGANAAQAGSNYLAPYNGSRRSYVPSIKVDQNLGSKLHAAFYFQKTSTSTPRTGTGADDLPDNITVSGTSGNAARTYRLNLDHTADANVPDALHLGLERLRLLVGARRFREHPATLGLSGAISPGRGLPLIATGVSSNTAEGGMNNLGPQYDQHFWERRPSFVTSATYVRGAHTYKAGFEIRQMKYPNFNFTYTAGEYTFGTRSGASVGNASNYTTQTSLNGTTVSIGLCRIRFRFVSARRRAGNRHKRAHQPPDGELPVRHVSARQLESQSQVDSGLRLALGLRNLPERAVRALWRLLSHRPESLGWRTAWRTDL